MTGERMGLSEFEVITGMVDAILIIMGVVLLVRVKMVRKTLRTRKKVQADDTPSFPDISRDSSSVTRVREEEEAFRKEQDRERKRFESLIRDAEQMRAELQVLFYDIESLVDELARMREAVPPAARPADLGEAASPAGQEEGGMYILPGEDDVDKETPVKVPDRDMPLKETVLALSREGHSVPDIAQAIGRSEGEVSFLLSLERVGQAG